MLRVTMRCVTHIMIGIVRETRVAMMLIVKYVVKGCCSQRITCVVMHAVRIMCVRALQVVTVNYVKSNKKYSLVVNDDSITATGPEGTDNIPITEKRAVLEAVSYTSVYNASD